MPAQGGVGRAGRRADSTLSSHDQMFVKMAAHGGMAEVADAKIIVGKTNDSAVKSFAERTNMANEPRFTVTALHWAS